MNLWPNGSGSLDRDGFQIRYNLEVRAKEFINPKAGFVTYQEVLRGARNILIKKIAGQAHLFEEVRKSFFQKAVLQSVSGKKVKTKSKYEAFFTYRQKLHTLFLKKDISDYLILRRGWKEGELEISIKNPQEEELLEKIKNFACPNEKALSKNILDAASRSALSLHMIPSIEKEIHRKLKDRADQLIAQKVSKKLKKLLLTGPLDGGPVLGVSPCGKTVCQLALVDEKGRFVSNTALKIQGEKALEKVADLFYQLLKQIEIRAIAVCENKGFRDIESFIRKVLKSIDKKIPVVLQEGSAAVYYSHL